jgi:hypothetical protein
MGGFRHGGPADVLAPGPELAALLTAAAGTAAGDGSGGAALGTLTEQEVLGVIAAGRRMAAWGNWVEMSALTEFAARRPSAEPPGFAADAADEVGFKVRMTWTSAASQMSQALTVAERLPQRLAALGAGLIDRVHVKIIAEQTAYLSPEDAAKADVLLAAAAQARTWGELSAFAARLVHKLDPDAARRRKEAGRREAHVRIYRETSGNGGLTGRELPADELLAGWQHIEQRALDLRAAGFEGSLRELQVRATLDLLTERDSRDTLTAPGSTGQAERAGAADGEDASGPQDRGPEHGRPDGGEDGSGPEGPRGPEGPEGPGNGGSGNGGPGNGGPDGPAAAGQDSASQDSEGADGQGAGTGNGRGRRGGGTSLAAQPVIVIPWEALTGGPAGPAEVPGFGLVDPETARNLIAAASRNPQTRTCVTITGPDGTAVMHGCARGPHNLGQILTDQAPGAGGPRAGPGPPGRPDPPPGSRSTTASDLIARLRARLAPITRDQCEHRGYEPGYVPSRALSHLIKARNATCTAPGCGKPAAACDLDHTIAWDNGGITCECGLAPLCRHHHKVKQTRGWQLTQPAPGTLTWQTPAGIQYTTGPTNYRD